MGLQLTTLLLALKFRGRSSSLINTLSHYYEDFLGPNDLAWALKLSSNNVTSSLHDLILYFLLF